MVDFHVFQDNDGCLADFNRHVFNLFGKYPNDIPDDDMWELILNQSDFWPTMPVKFGAHELFDVLRPYNPTILTGCHKSHFDVAAAHKRVWIAQNFGEDVRVITCFSRNKPLYMRNPGDILIDDFSSHIRRWQKAGGRGIHYRSYTQVIEEFRAIVGEVLNGEQVQSL